jgi:hypothetical protein
MNATLPVASAALAVFGLSSIWYTALTPIEARALGRAAVDRGKPSAAKALVELLRASWSARHSQGWRMPPTCTPSAPRSCWA